MILANLLRMAKNRKLFFQLADMQEAFETLFLFILIWFASDEKSDC
jgi:hypothetical protein